MNKELSGDYIAGFVDGEGCFCLFFRKDTKSNRINKTVYFSWRVVFAIELRADDEGLLQKIKDKLECGSVILSKGDKIARYQVGGLDDICLKIVPFFERHRLIGKKSLDFRLWADAARILFKYKKEETLRFNKINWKEEDLDKLKEIQNEMKNIKNFYKK